MEEREELVGPGRYMPSVTSVEVVGDYTLKLGFDDGLVRVIDLREELWGPVFEPLKDPAYFAQVALDPDGESICWPNGADFAPEFLHGDFEPERPRS